MIMLNCKLRFVLSFGKLVLPGRWSFYKCQHNKHNIHSLEVECIITLSSSPSKHEIEHQQFKKEHVIHLDVGYRGKIMKILKLHYPICGNTVTDYICLHLYLYYELYIWLLPVDSTISLPSPITSVFSLYSLLTILTVCCVQYIRILTIWVSKAPVSDIARCSHTV